MKNKKIIKNFFVTSCCSVLDAYAVDMNARDFYTAPPGTWASVTYLGYDHSNDFKGRADINNNASLKVTSLVHRLVRFTDCWGLMCSPQIVVPLLNMDIQGPGAATNRSKAGIGDISLGSGLWFINKPTEKRYMGILTTVIAPTGRYDAKNPGISAGSNRWQLHLNANNTFALSEKWTLEFEGEAQFYTKNKDYLGMTYRQQPLYKLKSYLSYDFNSENYLAFRFIHGMGGKMKLNGQKIKNTYTETTQLGVEYGHLITKNKHLLFGYTKDIYARNSFKSNHFQIRFAHSF